MIIYSSLYRVIKNGVLQVMPAPVDIDTPNALWQAIRALSIAKHIAAYGCNAWLHPPLTMSQSGASFNGDGYGKQYDLNVGQFPSRPTRWGYAKDIQYLNTVLHSLGMLVLEDAVIHQMDGGHPPFTYTELGSNGKPDFTLFQKTPLCFSGDPDKVFDPEGDNSFGDMVRFQGELGSYMIDGVIRSMKWRKKRFGLGGFRLDDTKGENVSVSRQIIDAVGGFVFGECFVGNTSELELWVKETGGKITLDFPRHWALQAVCDYGVSLSSLADPYSLANVDPAHAVTFVDSADTDLNNNENIKFHKLWAYWYNLTTPAAATFIYAGDYELRSLSKHLDQMMWTASVFAIGKIAYPFHDNTLIVWSRDGDGGKLGWSGGLLCAFSSEPIVSRSVWVKTPFDPNSRLHDYLGHGPDIWTNQDSWVYLTVGPNVNGTARNTVGYAPAGVEYKIPLTPIPETQTGSLTDFSDF